MSVHLLALTQARWNPHLCLLSFSSHSLVMINFPILLRHCPFSFLDRIEHLFAKGSPQEVVPHEVQSIWNCEESQV